MVKGAIYLLIFLGDEKVKEGTQKVRNIFQILNHLNSGVTSRQLNDRLSLAILDLKILSG